MDTAEHTTAAYRSLGRKTFWFLVFKQSGTAFLFLILGIALLIIQSQSFIEKSVATYVSYGGLACFGIAALSLIAALSSAELTYKTYKFMLDEDSLKIKSGIIAKNEIAIPYRQIQNVDIERSVLYQLFGVSRIVILTAGHEDAKSPESDEDEGILPALDKDVASWLQEELLKRTNVQKVIEEQ